MFVPCCSASDRPRVVESLRGKEVVDVAAGGAHSACITSAGELYTWGKGRYGRLGHGDSDDQARPKLVTLLFPLYACKFDTVSSDSYYTLQYIDMYCSAVNAGDLNYARQVTLGRHLKSQVTTFIKRILYTVLCCIVYK